MSLCGHAHLSFLFAPYFFSTLHNEGSGRLGYSIARLLQKRDFLQFVHPSIEVCRIGPTHELCGARSSHLATGFSTSNHYCNLSLLTVNISSERLSQVQQLIAFRETKSSSKWQATVGSTKIAVPAQRLHFRTKHSFLLQNNGESLVWTPSVWRWNVSESSSVWYGRHWRQVVAENGSSSAVASHDERRRTCHGFELHSSQ